MNPPATTTLITATAYGSLAYLPAIERLERASAAWLTHAPNAKFADLTWAEFQAATAGSRSARAALATLKLKIKGGIADRTQADKATRAMINRAIARVKGETAFGPDSALYRAMGFIPLSEQKRPAAARTPGEAAAAPKAPKPVHATLMERLATVRSAWAEIAPDEAILGMTLAQFDEAVAPSPNAREALAAIRTNHRAAVGLRNAADATSLALLRRVVSSIKADKAHGTDSALYRALGYIPDSERRIGRRPAAQ